MTETIWKNGLTQKVRFTALATDYTDFTGSTTGEALPGVILVYSENRSTGWVDQVIETPVCEWNAENVAIWEAEIPASYITLSRGNATLQISGTGMKMVTIPLTIGGAIGMSIIPHGQYTINATAKTITLDDTSITISQIEEIYNVSKQADIWVSKNARNYISVSDPGRDTKLDIKMDNPGVITYEADIKITNTDILQIKYHS
jgi:hypothetical protein